MADYNSELPIRSQLPGQVNPDDVIVKLGDATNPTTQQAEVDSFGSQQAVIKDAAGNAIGDQNLASSWWFQVVSPATGPAAPGTAAAYSDLAGGIYNATPPTLTDGQQASLQLDMNGRLLVDTSNTDDHNYGVVGAHTLRTAAQIGNATGAADFNYGLVGAQTLRVASQIGNATGAADFNWGTVGAQTLRVASEVGNATGAADFGAGATTAQTLRTAANTYDGSGNPINSATLGGNTYLDTTAPNIGPASPGAAAAYAALVGGIYNSTPETLTNTQQSSLQLDSHGYLLVDLATPIPAGSNLIGSVNVDFGGTPVSPSNPLPVTIEAAPGTHINDYKDAASLAKAATDNHDYTVSAGKTLYLNQVESTSSGKIKVQVMIETGVATGIFNTKFTQFNSTATPNSTIHMDDDIIVATGVRVRVAVTNLDNQAMDVYSTICGYEV